MLISPKSHRFQLESSSTTKTLRIGNNMVYGSHCDIYQDLTIIKPLTTGKFPVYVVQSRVTKKNYVMKVFAYERGQPSLYFRNESRFTCLQHPNVIRNLYFQSQRKSTSDDQEEEVSYIITEYASQGNFLNFLRKNRKNFDDKLTRTYFQQLIDGLEYLQSNGVSHMDLKLDNLLLDDDFNLKIADFDMSHYKDDAIIISNGTKFYRAPEVLQGRCRNPEAADIYSSAIILFTMKSRGIFPQFEGNQIGGIAFSDLLSKDTKKFWKEHCKIQKHDASFYDEDFKELFESMTREGLQERATIRTIKASKWYNGPVYSPEEVRKIVKRKESL